MNGCILTIVSEPRPTRSERKEQTRQTLLDAGVALAAEHGFGAVSLREVTRAAGIVPTAFYRHFPSLDELGRAIADDGLRDLRLTLRTLRRSPTRMTVRAAVDAVIDRARTERELLGFLARERHGGSADLRRAIADGLQLLAAELAVDLSRVDTSDADPDDMEFVADLLVSTSADRIADFLDANPDDEPAVINHTIHQLRLILLGSRAWQPRRQRT